MLLLLDGCELRLDGTELRLDGTGCTPGRGGRELRDLAEGARPEPGPLSPPPWAARSPRKDDRPRLTAAAGRLAGVDRTDGGSHDLHQLGQQLARRWTLRRIFPACA